MTEINGSTTGANAQINAATSATDPIQTARTAQNERVFAQAANETAETVTNNTSSYFQWAKEGVDHFANATATSFSEVYAGLSARFSQLSSGAQTALSYDGLSQAGQDAFESSAEFISGTLSRLASSDSANRVNEWIGIGVENVASAANKTAQASINSYLPLSVVALGVLTAGYSAKKAVESIRTNHFGRSVVQVLVGASAAVIAGSIAYGSPVGQSLDSSVRGLFNRA